MGTCESCGAENVTTQWVGVGIQGVYVCPRCFASIEKDKAAKEYYDSQTRSR